jgi:hypothetical protein
MDSSRRHPTITGISSKGIEAIDGMSREGYAVNFNIINGGATITNSQWSMGNIGSPSQNKVDANGSTGSTNVIGNSNVVHSMNKTQPIDVHPYSEEVYGYLGFGKWLMNRLYGTLDHSLKSLIIGASAFTIIPVASIALGTLRGFALFASSTTFYGTVGSLGFGVVLWITVGLASKTTCPQCHFRFSYVRTKRVLKASKNLPEKEVRNYVSSYACDHCGYVRDQVNETVEIPRQSDY